MSTLEKHLHVTESQDFSIDRTFLEMYRHASHAGTQEESKSTATEEEKA